jgi:hypothetical protein
MDARLSQTRGNTVPAPSLKRPGIDSRSASFAAAAPIAPVIRLNVIIVQRNARTSVARNINLPFGPLGLQI